jgi:hypothetical protein
MDEHEREASIQHILDVGLIKPQSTRSYLQELYRQLGLRYIFWDGAQILALAAVTIVATLVLLHLVPGHMSYSTLFAASPAVFLLTLALSQDLERANGLYELLATGKYDRGHIAALRTMGFALIGMVSSTAAGLWLGVAAQLLQMISLSLAALFICAAASLLLLMRLPGRAAAPAAIALWGVVAIAPMLLQPAAWESILAGLPLAFTLVVALAAAAATCLEFIHLLKTPTVKEPVHVAN